MLPAFRAREAPLETVLPGGAPPTAVIVDELALARAGVVATVRPLGVDVVAETHAAREGLRVAQMDACDLAIVGAPADLDVVDAARRFRTLRRPPTVVTLVPPARQDLVPYLLALGVEGVALRTGPVEDLAHAVDAAVKGVVHVAPGLAGALAGSVRLSVAGGDDAGLSAREREVLAFLAEGRSNRDIAAAMTVSLATVKTHLHHLYAKLGVANRHEALRKGVALGLLR